MQVNLRVFPSRRNHCGRRHEQKSAGSVTVPRGVGSSFLWFSLLRFPPGTTHHHARGSYVHRLSRLAAILAATALLTPTAAQAQITVFNSVAGWLSAVSTPGLDTFNDLDIAEGFYETPLFRNAGVHGYRASAVEGFVPAGVDVGPPPLSDTWLSNFFVQDVMVFDNFSPSVRGVGAEFFLTNASGLFVPTGQISITVVSGAFTDTQTLTNATTTSFRGFTTVGAINSVTVAAVRPNSEQIFATVNNFRLGAAPTSVIPEPSTYLLMATGVVVLGALSRRRRAA